MEPEIQQTTVGRFPDLAKRTGTALLVMPPVLAAVWFGGIAFSVLLVASAALIAREWARMTGGPDRLSLLHAALAALAAAICLLPGDLTNTLLALGIGTGIILITDWKSARRWLQSLSLILAVLPVISLDIIRGTEGDEAARLTVFWLLAVVWSTDIGAYMAGRIIGGPKLMPKVSPKKTWSGAIGGVSAAIGVSIIFHSVGEQFIQSVGHSLVIMIFGTICLSIVSQIGDLMESAAKRHCDFKDSGSLLPGHGGILDRVDGLITAAIALAVFVLLTGKGMF